MLFVANANTLEWLAAVFVFAVVLLGQRAASFLPQGLLDWPIADQWTKALLGAVVFLALLMSASEVSQFQTTDESYYINHSILNPDVRGTDVWIQGGLHTG